MFYANFADAGKNDQSNLYYSFSDFHRDTFSPECEIFSVIEFAVHGKTYKDRQADLKETAMRFQSENAPGLSWLEVATIQDWFYTMGKRYGLLKEFRDNCIC